MDCYSVNGRVQCSSWVEWEKWSSLPPDERARMMAIMDQDRQRCGQPSALKSRPPPLEDDSSPESPQVIRQPPRLQPRPQTAPENRIEGAPQPQEEPQPSWPVRPPILTI
jgi:hypothetical protein